MDIALNFPIYLYGVVEKVNETLSKSRARIFYKGGNRNGTFITDEFAEKLIASLPYAPVKGIFDEDDFTDHGKKRTEGRIYGIVPAKDQMNFAWESHLDDDGVERIYATTDVLLFTALYPEANIINDKPLSMELYQKTLKYHFEIMNGIKFAVFEEGCFLGLQVLGNNVEPCFEGAGFFTLQEQVESIIKLIETYQGGKAMPTINFKLSDGQKFEALWSLLNPLFNEEGNWTITNCICEVYDNYALVYNCETAQHERVYYTKDNETDSVALGDKETAYIVDVTVAEKAVLDRLEALNGGTYEKVSETLENAENYAAQNSELNTKIEEMTSQISTLEMDKEKISADYVAATEKISAQEASISEKDAELESLREYRLNIENQNKNAVIEEYVGKVSDEVLETYRAKLGEYTVEDLDMRLAYELKKSNIGFFEKKGEPASRIPKESQKSSLETFLDKYRK